MYQYNVSLEPRTSGFRCFERESARKRFFPSRDGPEAAKSFCPWPCGCCRGLPSGDDRASTSPPNKRVVVHILTTASKYPAVARVDVMRGLKSHARRNPGSQALNGRPIGLTAFPVFFIHCRRCHQSPSIDYYSNLKDNSFTTTTILPRHPPPSSVCLSSSHSRWPISGPIFFPPFVLVPIRLTIFWDGHPTSFFSSPSPHLRMLYLMDLLLFRIFHKFRCYNSRFPLG